MLNPLYKTMVADLADGKTPYLLTAISGSIAGSKALLRNFSAENLICSDEIDRKFWHDLVKDINLSSSPRVIRLPDESEVYIQPVSIQPKLVIFGGGHISLPLAEIGKLLGFHVTVVDEREEFANSQRFPGVDRIICAPFTEAVNNLEYLPDTYYVIVTRGHLYDRLCLEAVLAHTFTYVGMIGSRHKIKVVMDHMRANGYSQELLDMVHSPIGLDIGAQTPAEIAVCIAAEIIQVKNQKENSSFVDEKILEFFQNPTQPAALATIVEKKGSSPRSVGAQMLVLQDGSLIGSIGGGGGEKEAYDIALQVIKEGNPRLIDYNMTNNDAEKAGMVCGGQIRIFIEPI